MLERIPTGVAGLDVLIDDGIPKGSTVLVSGDCDFSKFYFCSEFLYRAKDSSILYSFEKDEQEFLRINSLFNWDLQEKIKANSLHVIKSELYQFESFLSNVEDILDKYSPERFVLDSFTLLGFFFDTDYRRRKALLDFKRVIQKANTTAFVLSDTTSPDKISTFGIEEFVLDGVFQFISLMKGSTLIRGLLIRKLINSNNDLSIHPVEIRKTGLKIHRLRELF
ncbi:MAG: ATPase domain-containing protein [archaeon]